MRKRTAVATFSILLTLTAAATGCTARFDITPQPDDDTSVADAKAEQTEDVFDLSVGDCLNTVAGDQVKDVPVVPCEQPHDEEIYFEFALDEAAEYPGQDIVVEQARSGCLEEFENFVGIAYEDSVLDYYPLFPTAEGWDSAGDRTVQCVAWDTTGQMTGSLAGARR